MQPFLQLLEKENELVHIHEQVDPTYEIAEIHRRVVAQKGKALLFHNVASSRFPVATNLFGSEKRIELAFGRAPEKCIQDIISLITAPLPPKMSALWRMRHTLQRLLRLGTKQVRHAPVMQCSIDPVNLHELPLLKLWPEDGGHFITLPLVYTESPDRRSQNLGMYRIQRFDNTTTGLHFQIAKGGGFHYVQAENQGLDLPVTLFVGGPAALILSAIAPLPENVPELLFASFVQGKKLTTAQSPGHPHPILAECDFALLGHSKPNERRPEGPFGDHFGYYSLTHDFPVFHCKKIYHRKDAVWPATVVGKPVQEDLYIGNYLQKLFSPLFPVLMPQVKELHTFGETGFHPLAAARVRERYEKEAWAAAFRILGEGQLSLTKCLMITDADIQLSDANALLEAVLSRLCPKTGLMIVPNTSNDTLDYTGPKLNKGSKMIVVATGEPKRALPGSFHASLPRGCRHAAAFCKGCLVLEGDVDIDTILAHVDFADWPLLILVDNAAKTSSNALEFLWTVFTRFEPARDIHCSHKSIARNSVSFSLPILIDARMKPWYPKEVEANEETIQLVDRKWPHYFPQ